MDNGAGSYHRFLEGDESAFDEILELYREGLIFFINRYVRNIDTAEDLAEDTFLELLIHPRRYNFKASLKTYLYTIGRNKAVNYIRRAGKCVAQDPSELQTGEGDAAALPEAELLRREESRALNAALDRLLPEYRAALHLVYFEELSYESAARVMKKSKKQVENLVYRGKKALRAILGKEGFEL